MWGGYGVTGLVRPTALANGHFGTNFEENRSISEQPKACFVGKTSFESMRMPGIARTT